MTVKKGKRATKKTGAKIAAKRSKPKASERLTKETTATPRPRKGGAKSLLVPAGAAALVSVTVVANPVNTANLKWDGQLKRMAGVGTSWSTTFDTSPGNHTYELNIATGRKMPWSFSVTGGAAAVNGNSTATTAGTDTAEDDVTV
jgi:hypothetical protein